MSKETVRARLYGTPDRMGRVVEFEIMDELPEEGELQRIGDVWTWGKATPARLDPEQLTGDDDKRWEYDFWEVEEIDGDGDVSRCYIATPSNVPCSEWEREFDTLEEIDDYLREQHIHAISGGLIRSVEDWCEYLTAKEILEFDGARGYLEDLYYEGGDPYEFDTPGNDYPPIFADGEEWGIIERKGKFVLYF